MPMGIHREDAPGSGRSPLQAMFDAGYQTNVIPGKATARVDGRFLPGHEQELIDTIDRLLLPSVTREWVNHDIATTFDVCGEAGGRLRHVAERWGACHGRISFSYCRQNHCRPAPPRMADQTVGGPASMRRSTGERRSRSGPV